MPCPSSLRFLLPLGLLSLSLGALAACNGDVDALNAAAQDEGDPLKMASDGDMVPEDKMPVEKSPPSAYAPPMAPPPNGSQGVFGCPTIDPPKYTFAMRAPEDTGLSTQFAQACASCHGTQGQGLPGYPQLPGTLSKEAFIEKVRQGTGEGMPSFGADFVSDAVLGADYDTLGSRGAGGGEPEFGTEWDWEEAEQEEARRQGLAVWRMPDPQGVACANCHTPDAIDLALLGYPDHAITRRARLHLGPQDTLKVVKFVHAQRRHLNISQPCHPHYRPLQPGGQVLPGAGPREQDEAFGALLRQRGLSMATGRIETLEDAQVAMKEVADINLRTLPTGIALPRWTEDGFNGQEHSTMNDYMPPLGFRPKDAQAWYDLSDAYIHDPSEKNLLKILSSFDKMNDDGGYKAHKDTKIYNCRVFDTAGSFLHDMATHKRQSQWLMQHWLRRGLLQGLELGDIKPLPLALEGDLKDQGVNPFLMVGRRHIEEICYPSTPDGKRAGEEIIKAMPQDVLDELPQQDIDSMTLVQLPVQVNHPWMTLAQIYDPSYGQSTPHPNSLHYWQSLKFPHKRFHRPFYAVHRNMQRVSHYELAQKDAQSPDLPGNTRLGTTRIHPWLDGNRVFIRESLDERGQKGPENVRMNGNVIRAVLLVQLSLLDQGFPYTNRTTFVRQIRTFKAWTEDVRRNAKDDTTLAQTLGADYALYTDGVDQLSDRLNDALVPEQLDTQEHEESSR